MEAPFTFGELEKVIKQMNKARFPGLGGLPAELFVQFSSQLGPFAGTGAE